MKKVIKGLVLLTPIILLIVLGVFHFWFGALVERAVTKIGPEVLGAPVTMENMTFQPFVGEAKITGLVIGNPEGFKTPHAFSLASMEVSLDLASLFSGPVLIRRLHIERPEMTIEGLRADNLRALQRNARQFGGGKPAGEEPAEPDAQTGEPARKVIIEEFVMTEGTLRYTPGLTMGQTVDVPLPELRLQDIGRKTGGATAAEVVAAVLDQMEVIVTGTVQSAGNLFEQMGGKISDEDKERIEEGLNKALGAVSDFLGKGGAGQPTQATE